MSVRHVAEPMAKTEIAQVCINTIRTLSVVSMPSWEIFENQTRKYCNSVLPPEVVARVAIEQAWTFGWERCVGVSGRTIGMETFGASAPLKALQKKFGFEPDRVALIAKALLGAE